VPHYHSTSTSWPATSTEFLKPLFSACVSLVRLQGRSRISAALISLCGIPRWASASESVGRAVLCASGLLQSTFPYGPRVFGDGTAWTSDTWSSTYQCPVCVSGSRPPCSRHNFRYITGTPRALLPTTASGAAFPSPSSCDHFVAAPWLPVASFWWLPLLAKTWRTVLFNPSSFQFCYCSLSGTSLCCSLLSRERLRKIRQSRSRFALKLKVKPLPSA